MTNKDIRKVFNIPEKNLLLLVLQNVNLKDKELQILELCFMNGLTEEEASEELNISVNGLQKIKRKAVEKVKKQWTNNSIIDMILNRE